VFQLFAVGNAALLAAFWAMRKEVGSEPSWVFFLSGLLIRTSGVAVCWTCFLIARHLGSLAIDYQVKANQLSRDLCGINDVVVDSRARGAYIEQALFVLTILLTLAWFVGFFFLEMQIVYRSV
jgi:hypothetical protein